jgi:hypothetical protein
MGYPRPLGLGRLFVALRAQPAGTDTHRPSISIPALALTAEAKRSENPLLIATLADAVLPTTICLALVWTEVR